MMEGDDPPAEPADLYRKLLEAEGRLGEGVLVYDLAEDEVVFATATFYDILDVEPEAIEALPDITHLVAKEHRPELLEKMQGFLEGNDIQDHEFPIVLDDGSWRWLRAAGTLLGPDDTRIVVTLRDVTEQVRTRAERELLLELTRATAEADDLDEALSEVLAIVGPATGWALGETWVPADDGSGLEHRETWSAEGTASDAWRRATADLDPDPHRGIPGRAWTGTHPVWIDDIASADVFVRADEAAEMGLDAAVAIPISEGDEVLAVLLFLTEEITGDDRRRAELVRDAIAQLGGLVRRKEAETGMRERQRLLEDTERTARIGQWGWDLRTDRVLWSDETYRLLGREPGDPADPTFGDFTEQIHPEDRDHVEAMLEAAIAGSNGEPGDFTYRIVRPDGEVRWMESRAEVEVEDGEAVRMRGKILDVTERKEAEQVLAEERDRLTRAQALAGVGDWHWDTTTDEIVWSEELARIHGRPAGWAPEDAEESLAPVHPDDRDLVMEAVMEAATADRSPEVVYRIVEPGGETRWLRARIEPVTDGTGEVVGLRGVCHDVTEAKRAEQDLEAAHDRLERMLSEAPVIMFVLDADGVYQMSRGSGLGAIGLDTDEHVGESAFEIYADHPQIPDDIRCALDGDHVTNVVELSGAWLHVSYSPQFDADGDVTGVIGVAVDVTEQRRAEEELVAARDRLAFVVSESPAVTYTAEVHPGTDELLGETTFVSDNAEEVIGYPPETFVGNVDAWIERVHPDDRERLVARARELAETGHAETQYRVRSADGSYVWIRDEARIATDADGTPRELVGSLLDVTDRVLAEQQVEATRDRLDSILAQSPAMTYTAEVRPDADRELGELTFLSANVEELTGYPPETFVGDTEAWLERIHPDDFDRLVDRIEQLTETGGAVVEYRARDADGEWRWFRDEVQIVTDADGKPQELVGSILDVTEQRDLEDEDRRKAQLLDEVSDAVIVTDAEGEITYWNRAAEELYGWTADEARGRNVMEVTVPDLSRDEAVEIMETVAAGEVWTGEFEAQQKDGSTFPVRVADKPILDEDGELEAVIGISHDISREKARERELLRTANALEARNRQLRNLGVAAAHHLQEPIRDIVRYAQLVEDRGGDRLTDDDREDLQTVHGGGKRLQKLVDAFQTYVEQATGDPPGDGPADAEKILQKVLRGLDRSADDLASITWDQGPKLGIDPEELETLLGELIGNAILFRDGDHVAVHVGFERVDEMWIVSVADDGIGIPSEHHERIFRPLETLHHRSEYPGVGIGLAICRGIVERRGGGIWVKSTPGEGSTFYATVPAVGADGDPALHEVL